MDDGRLPGGTLELNRLRVHTDEAGTVAGDAHAGHRNGVSDSVAAHAARITSRAAGGSAQGLLLGRARRRVRLVWQTLPVGHRGSGRDTTEPPE